jgi:hypothetical protein
MEMIQLIEKNVPSFKACQNSWMAEAMARIKDHEQDQQHKAKRICPYLIRLHPI